MSAHVEAGFLTARNDGLSLAYLLRGPGSSCPRKRRHRRREDLKEHPGEEEEKQHMLPRYAGRPFSIACLILGAPRPNMASLHSPVQIQLSPVRLAIDRRRRSGFCDEGDAGSYELAHVDKPWDDVVRKSATI
jgi:hypothetical protein